MTKLVRDKWEIDKILSRKITEQEALSYGLTSEKLADYKKNRQDHRHHALDAFVIALTDRSLVQQISTLNARKQKNRIEVPELPILRTEIEDKVRNIVVSFKPDHGAQGKLSKTTNLGRILLEEEVLIKDLTIEDVPNIKEDNVRDELSNFIASNQNIKELQKKYKAAYPSIKVLRPVFVARCSVGSIKELKDIITIIDNKVRKDLLEIEATCGDKKELEKKLQEYFLLNNIKNIRCKNKDQKPIEISKSKAKRYVATEDYLCSVIWKTPEGSGFKYEGQFIRRDQFDSFGKIKNGVLKAPTPEAIKVCTLCKDDYLELSVNNKFIICRVRGFSATNGKFDIRPIYALGDNFDWLHSTNETMINNFWKDKKGQNFIVINKIFDNYKARYVTVNPIGRVFRKDN